jgi:transcriptional regulator with XRE-family HTH domain
MARGGADVNDTGVSNARVTNGFVLLTFCLSPFKVPNVADVDVLYQRFGDLIRRHRRRMQPVLTQEELGRRVGLSRTSITNIEKGRQKVLLHQLCDLAAALETTPASLLPEPLAPTAQVDDLNHRLAHAKGAEDTTASERQWITRILETPGKP